MITNRTSCDYAEALAENALTCIKCNIAYGDDSAVWPGRRFAGAAPRQVDRGADTALFGRAGDLPPIIISDPFGVHRNTANAWAALPRTAGPATSQPSELQNDALSGGASTATR
ncbi:hypothetical protein GCM10011579_062910 [Streptomyces albiflavescens]|uniref:Uncharacterized protein n=1 Tax=Streptomyces albiflavescens TaxID=1623582 RepID=A0A917Y8V0_9ACTN|nr:hypothetical protein GCM10011579_062910 [Streptomyces albiflavescens]